MLVIWFVVSLSCRAFSEEDAELREYCGGNKCTFDRILITLCYCETCEALEGVAAPKGPASKRAKKHEKEISRNAHR